MEIARPTRFASLAVLAVFGLLAACQPSAPEPRLATAEPPVAAYPIRVLPGTRHFVDSAGRPFLVHGDAAWGLITQLRRDEAERYLADRRRRGFNTLLVEIVEHHFSAHAPRNAYGIEPFKVPGDFSTPNEEYFDHVDWVIRRARDYGMLVMLTPAYMGYEGKEEGWYQEMVANGPAKLHDWGRYIARRLRGHDNLLWVEGGDFVPPEFELLRAVASGVRAELPDALQTFHGSRGTSALGVLGTAEPWLNVNATYTDEHTVVEKSLAEYRRSTLPFFLIEARYEGSWHATDATVRMEAYQSVLSGSAGQIMGHSPLWELNAGWEAYLDNASARSMTQLRRLLEARAWWTLVPDLDGTLLVAGAGSGPRAAAARASDGSFALAYVPTPRAVTLDLGRLAGPHVNAWWFDPAAGRFSPVPGSPFAASGARVFTTAAPNSRGQGDWVLLLESAP